MKLKQPVIRCGYCRHLVIGQGMHHEGVVYCSRSCRELGIERASKKARGWGGWLSVVFLSLGAILGMGATDSWAHDPYSGWMIPGQNKSCCNIQDCRPTPAKFERGHWWAKHRDLWIKVPDDRIVKYKTQDTDAHLCISEHTNEVFCFRPPPTGM